MVRERSRSFRSSRTTPAGSARCLGLHRAESAAPSRPARPAAQWLALLRLIASGGGTPPIDRNVSEPLLELVRGSDVPQPEFRAEPVLLDPSWRSTRSERLAPRWRSCTRRLWTDRATTLVAGCISAMLGRDRAPAAGPIVQRMMRQANAVRPRSANPSVWLPVIDFTKHHERRGKPAQATGGTNDPGNSADLGPGPPEPSA